MPEIRDSELSGPWADLSKRASQFIGVVKISEVTFDKTHRQFVDDEIISEAAKI